MLLAKLAIALDGPAPPSLGVQASPPVTKPRRDISPARQVASRRCKCLAPQARRLRGGKLRCSPLTVPTHGQGVAWMFGPGPGFFPTTADLVATVADTWGLPGDQGI